MSILEKFNNYPDQISSLSNGALFIPIISLEEMLDEFDNWGTQNFNYTLYRDTYGKHSVAASIELFIEYEKNGKCIRRTFVGAANLDAKELWPNIHFLATIKSECIKNAASDIASRFGRGLNKDFVPQEPISVDKIVETALVESLDEITPENYAPKIKNKQNKSI